MIKKTTDKLFYCGKAQQLLEFLNEINKENTILKDFLNDDLKKCQSVASSSTTS